MPSFAGIVACGCFKIQPMNGDELEQELVPFDAQDTPPR